MLNTIQKLIAVLVRLLSYEASKNAKLCNHLGQKAYNHRAAEDRAVRNIKEAGSAYRHSLYNKADVCERQADKASALASKIGSLLE